ncbi:MAG TPA: YggT family protein [Candidatus Sulfomarinibacteraceae bacterium]|nr:YggT family protein [Candidatus Sulfomarinibacteraceae bacterium]
MNDDLREPRQTKVREEIVQEGGPAPVDRREEVRVYRDIDSEHREHIVQDVGAEREATLSRISGLIWLLTGVLEFGIGLRVLLKLMAANPNAPFVNLVYSVTDLFLWPFLGLTVTPQANGMVLEFSSIIAMVVYAVLAWIVVRLLWLIASPSRSRRVTVERHEQY